VRFAPAHHQAGHLVRLLAEYDYLSFSYYGSDGVEEILLQPD